MREKIGEVFATFHRNAMLRAIFLEHFYTESVLFIYWAPYIYRILHTVYKGALNVSINSSYFYYTQYEILTFYYWALLSTSGFSKPKQGKSKCLSLEYEYVLSGKSNKLCS